MDSPDQSCTRADFLLRPAGFAGQATHHDYDRSEMFFIVTTMSIN